MVIIQILEQIGEGLYSKVYRCKINNELAVYKLTKIDNYNKGFSSQINRQIDFNKFCKKYFNNFMLLKDYGIVKNCDLTFDISNEEKKNKIKDCIYFIYTPLLDRNLFYIRDSLNDKEYNIMIKTLSKTINIMNKNGYYHRDIHSKNIMYKINNNKIQWYIIDYGRIWNKKYIRTKEDKNIDNLISYNNDIISFLKHCFLDMPGYYICKENNILKPSLEKRVEIIKKTKQFPIIKKFILKNIPEKYINHVIEIITVIIFNEIHILSFVGFNNYEKFKRFAVPHRSPKLLLDLLKYIKDATF